MTDLIDIIDERTGAYIFFAAVGIFLFIMLVSGASAASDLSKSSIATAARVDNGVATFSVTNTTITATTNINGAAFTGVEKAVTSKDVKYKSGEKTLFIISDPVIQQTYEYLDTGKLKETVVLKAYRDISYMIGLPSGSYLQSMESGEYKVTNPKANEKSDGYIVIEKPSAVDSAGNNITLGYKFDGVNTLSVVFPPTTDNGETIQYPVTVDPIIDHRYQLVFLLHSNLEPSSFSTTDFRESSRYFNTGKFNATANINTTFVKYGNASLFLKNQGNISFNNGPQYTFGLNNFSIVGYVYFPSTAGATNVYLYYHYDNASNIDSLSATPGAGLGQIHWYPLRSGNPIGDTTASTLTISYDAWHQIGVIQNGTATTLYLDGAAVGSPGTRTASLTALQKSDISIVPIGAGAVHIDEVSIFNGGFAPTIDQFSGEYPLYLNASVNGANMGYADDNNTVSLLHFDGANAGTVFNDSVGNRTWTSSGGTVTAVNWQKFGSASLYSPTSGYIGTSAAQSQIYNFSTGCWTVDFWVNPIAGTTFYPVYATGANTAGYAITVGPTYVAVSSANSGSWLGDAVWYFPALTVGTPSHIAIERTNLTTLAMYKDGSLISYATIPSGYVYNQDPALGGIRYNYVAAGTGQIDELRVSNIARWTSNFNPPTSPYELITNVTSSATPKGSGTAPATIQFNATDPSGAWTNNTYLWTFGDGGSSTLQNPTHTYSSNGINTVSLTVSNNNMSMQAAPLTMPIGAPFVDFAGSPITGTAALLVTFTDLTTNATPITSYSLDFGDGTVTTAPPSAARQWQHVYATFGVYYVNLTETNSVGTGFNNKSNYIITSTSQNTVLAYTPKDIRLHVTTIWGKALPGTFITANVTQTSLGSYSYVASLYGYSLQGVPLANLTLQGFTDSKGDITLAAMADVTYNMTYALSGYTFLTAPSTLTMHDDNYIIIADSVGSPFVANGSPVAAQVNWSVPYDRTNLTRAVIKINFSDVSGTTTGGFVNLSYLNTTVGAQNTTNSSINIFAATFAGNSTSTNITVVDYVTTNCAHSTSTVYTNGVATACINGTLVDDKSYTATVYASNPGGNIIETASVAFKKLVTPMQGLPPELYMDFAVFLIILIALIGAAVPSAAPAVCVVDCFAAWILFWEGAFIPLGNDTAFIATATVATFVSFMACFVAYRRSNK